MTASLFAHFLPHLHCSLSALLFSPAETRPGVPTSTEEPALSQASTLRSRWTRAHHFHTLSLDHNTVVWGAAGWVDIGLAGAFAIDANKKTTWVPQFDLPETPTWVALGRYGKMLWEHIVKTDAIKFPTEKTGSRIVATLCYPNANGYTIFQSTIPRGALRKRMTGERDKGKRRGRLPPTGARSHSHQHRPQTPRCSSTPRTAPHFCVKGSNQPHWDVMRCLAWSHTGTTDRATNPA